MHSQAFIEEMKQQLLAHKQQLTEELAGLSVHTEVGDELDENATEVQIDDVNHSVMERINNDLKKIDVALERIEAGTYGLDADGAEISEARLRVIPWADTSI